MTIVARVMFIYVFVSIPATLALAHVLGQLTNNYEQHVLRRSDEGDID
jgi:hypothetical protein